MTILPQAKHFILPVTVLMLAAPQMAFAQSSGSLSGLYACEQLAGDAAQLACFRAETAKIRASDSFGGSVTAETQRLAAERERLAVERQRIEAEKESLAKAKKPAFNEDFEKKRDAPKSQTLAITQAQDLRSKWLYALYAGKWRGLATNGIRAATSGPSLAGYAGGQKGQGSAGYIGKVNDKRPTFRVKRVK